MFRLYYNLAKKSTLMIFLGIFLCSSAAVAKIPNDPDYPQQQTMWQQINAEQAWDYGVGSNQVTVAIIDTGADIWHEDIKQNVWINFYETPSNGYDDDGNGFIDDVNGWNFIENNNDVRTGVQDNTDDPEAIRHGTVVAGLIGAVGDNKHSGTGLNWRVSLMPLRAIASDGSGSYEKVIQAIRYAIDNDADVISLSIVGFEYSEEFKKILREAYDKGIVIVAAAGNDRQFGIGDLNTYANYPICFDVGSTENWIIGVSSVNNNDQLSRFANYGNCVDIVAPGENIFSTERYAPVFGYNEEFSGPWVGTSFAVPLVAGTAALIKSFHPNASAKEIIDAILNNADFIKDKNPIFFNSLGFGRLNVGEAVINAPGLVLPADFIPIYKYSYKNNIIYFEKEGVKEVLSSSGSATIISLTAARSTNNKRDEVFVLVKRGKNYFIQFINEKGRLWKEVFVPTTDYSSTKKPINITVIRKDGVRQIQLKYTQKLAKKVIKNTSKFYNWLLP